MGCAQGTDVWVRVPASRQVGWRKRSALHWASAEGLAGTVAQLLALGADATLTDRVRASISVNRYQRVLICIRINTHTLVCDTAWKPERSSLVSLLIVRDNTGQARTSLDPASGYIHICFCLVAHCICIDIYVYIYMYIYMYSYICNSNIDIHMY